nr:DUF2800 domain-containing protein [uncultured Clostridium sp.]
MSEERSHALLSASSAKKWIHCPPSARLEETFPDESSKAAEEGTLAHSFCELKLRKLFIEPGMPDKTYKAELNKLKKDTRYNPEMDRFTDDYVAYIQKIAYGYPSTPYISVEKKIDYSHVAPEGFGTADCIILCGSDLHVVDFKYGKGVVVSAEENPQMGLYAIGALAAYSLIYPIDQIMFHIVQPRVHNFSSWKTTAKDLQDWADAVVKPNALLAFKGEGDFCQGTWCDEGFCKAAGQCRHRMNENMEVLQKELNPVTGKLVSENLISNEDIGKILPLLQLVSPWIKKVEKVALNKLLSDEAVPGWKLVEGRSNRELTDATKAFKDLIAAGYKKAMLYEQKPLALTEVEKLITKEDYTTILSPYIVKPKGKPTLAPENDKRSVYQKDSTPEEDFGGENHYKEEQTQC